MCVVAIGVASAVFQNKSSANGCVSDFVSGPTGQSGNGSCILQIIILYCVLICFAASPSNIVLNFTFYPKMSVNTNHVLP